MLISTLRKISPLSLEVKEKFGVNHNKSELLFVFLPLVIPHHDPLSTQIGESFSEVQT